MGIVTTVLGDIKSAELGFCQSHEHIFVAKGQSFEVNNDILIDDADKSAEELRAYKAAGGGAIIDAQPVGCGRDASAMEQISRESGVRVVASTGFHKLVFYQEGHWIHSRGADDLARIYIDELMTGMYALCDFTLPKEKTGFRAGQIKSAIDSCGLTAEYKKLFTAAANAAVETGRTLMTHIEEGSDPVALSDFLFKLRVSPPKMIFCHMDRAIPDLAIHKEILSRGIALEYDNIARPKYHGDARESEILRSMLEAGYAGQILMGLDTTRKRLKSYGGAIGLDYILGSFIPRLRADGISAENIGKIFVQNPARIFSHE